MIYVYREQSDNMAIHGCVIWQLRKAKVGDATDFQYQAFSSLDKHVNYVATAVEVKESIITKYVA